MEMLLSLFFFFKQSIPWSYIKTDPKTSTPLLDEQGNVQWEGYCIDFAERIAEKLDFDYVLVPPTRGLFGDRVPGLNNTWDGLVGDLVTGVKSSTAFVVIIYQLEMIGFFIFFKHSKSISLLLR